MKKILAPSMLSADFNILGKQISDIKVAGAEYLHVDVMDGLFVPSISFGMPVIKSIRGESDIIFDVHLMIEEPIRYIEEFAKAGADIITIHVEACKDIDATINAIKSCGKKVGITLKPATDIVALEPYIDKVDMILVMSVEPGFGGQSYIESSTEKIRNIRMMIDNSGRDIDLEVDGGINVDTIGKVVDAGANVIVAGSAVFKDDLASNVRTLLSLMNR